jgi:hypothetical protein
MARGHVSLRARKENVGDRFDQIGGKYSSTLRDCTERACFLQGERNCVLARNIVAWHML